MGYAIVRAYTPIVKMSSYRSPRPSPSLGPRPSPTLPPLGPTTHTAHPSVPGGEPMTPIELTHQIPNEEIFANVIENIHANIRRGTHLVKREARLYRIRENLAEALGFPSTQAFSKPGDVSRAVIAHCRRHGQVEGDMCYFDDYLHALFGVEEAPMNDLRNLVKPYIYIDGNEKRTYCLSQLKDLRLLQGHLRGIHQEMSDMMNEVEDIIEAMEEKIVGIEKVL